ncbi:MAG: HEAT repeat domain-containing protein, partial [Planctomycetes bacterium]|nr:HEAT repeat domain-containing protein [Planctomycetota bacterium]
MRFLAAVALVALMGGPLSAAETAVEWLDRAANPALTLREREYAAGQTLMLADPSASIIIAALRGEGSDSGLRRQVAAGLLGRLDAKVAEAPLLEAAFGGEYFLAEAAAAALARVYSRLPDGELYSLLRRGGRKVDVFPDDAGEEGGKDWLSLSLLAAETRGRFRAIAMRGLSLKYAGSGETLPDPLAACVWDGLLDADRGLRLYSIELAARTADRQAAEKLAVFLYVENDPKLLTTALRTMAAMRPPSHGEAVERHVGHADPLVALEALAALDAMGYENAMFPAVAGARAVAAYVAHPSTPVRRRAVELLAGTKNPAALEYLLAALFDRVGANRAASARALGELGFSGAVGGLMPLLRDGRPEVRAEAAVALARFGVIGITAAVLDDLAGMSPPFRRSAAETLGRIGDAR